MPQSTTSQHARALLHGMRNLVRPARLMLALKGAAAAVIAWFAASLLPGALDEYTYYAPLGAVISMSPTLIRSARAGLQTLASIALGIGIAWIAIIAPLPAVPALFLVIAIGMLLAGIPWLGAGREYVPIAAMFVIVVGGHDAEDFSLGFLVQMGLGAAIGFAVNLLIVPPVSLQTPSRRASALRDRSADLLDEMAEWVRDGDRDLDPEWEVRASTLHEDAGIADGELTEVQESRRINPRTFRRRHDPVGERDELLTVQWIIEHLRRLSESLVALHETRESEPQPTASRQALSETLTKLAAAVRVFHDDDIDPAEASTRIAEANDAMRRLGDQYARTRHGSPDLDPKIGTAIFAMRRIDELVSADPTKNEE